MADPAAQFDEANSDAATHLWPILSKWDSSVHIVEIEFLVYFNSMHSTIYNGG